MNTRFSILLANPSMPKAMLVATILLALLSGCSPSSDNDISDSATSSPASAEGAESLPPLVVYSSRNEQLIAPIFARYTQQTGQEIQFITDKAGPLIQRLKAEGEQTSADLLLTVDAGNLWFAQQQGVLQPMSSKILSDAVPAYLRDPDNFWYALSIRARTMVYHPQRVGADELSGYADLADPKWQGRLCLRTSKKVYNQSLVAMMIATLGEMATEKIVRGWVSNLAAPVFSSDTKLIEAIAAGQCDVGIANTYYLGRLLAKDANYPVALHWSDQTPAGSSDQRGQGVHVNVSGVALTAHSKQPKAAQQLVEWLATGEAQQQFAEVNLEFPLKESTSVAPIVAAWGSFEQQLINVRRAGELQADAVRLMDRAGYR